MRFSASSLFLFVVVSSFLFYSILRVRSIRFDPQLTLDHLRSLPIYEGQAVYSETLPGRKGEFADTLAPLHPEVSAALVASKGVTR